MNLKKAGVAVYSLITLFAIYYVFVNAITLSPLYAEGAFFWCVLVSAYVAAYSFFSFGGSFSEMFVPDAQGRINMNMPQFLTWSGMKKLPKYLLLLCWGAFIVGTILSSVFINWKAYRDQLGEPITKTFSSDVQTVDLTQIPIVDKELAYKLADKKLGERPSLGSQVLLGEPTIQMVNDKLVWAVPLQHSGFFKWLTNMEGTPGYITVSATNVNDVEYHDEYKIKYQPSSYLLHDLKRYTRFTAAWFDGITDYSFELDSTGQPYWVVTTYKNLRGFALPEATGILLVNSTTGETTKHDTENIPDWVDRVQPENFIVNQIYNKGEYVHGFLNFSDKDKFMPSRGTNIIYNNGRCYLFTGLTSVGNDESAIGFLMVDMVTKEPILYQMNGATEYSARASAQGKVQHLSYNATNPIIINLNGNPSYFMTLKDREGLIKQYAFVSVINYSTVGVGETVNQAMRDYENVLRNSGISGSIIDTTQTKEIDGTILRVSSHYDGTHTVYMVILEEYQNKLFAVSSDLSGEVAITQAGDKVKISYSEVDTGTLILQATKFDNLMFSQN